MEEIDIKSLAEFIVSKLRIIILITAIVVMVGAIYSLYFKEPIYESTTRLVLTGTASASGTTQTADGVTITQNDVNLNSRLVSTYREIIKSKTILKDVIETLGLNYTVSELANKISVSTVTDTEMINIAVKDSVAENTANIANELADKFGDQIKEIYNIENISVIDKAEVPTVPTNLNIVKQVIIYTLVGLVVSNAIVFLMFYFDTSLKDAKQIEKMGLTVLTSIPEKKPDGGRRR